MHRRKVCRLELARRHPDGTVPTDEERLRDFYVFRDFPHFAQVYRAVNELVRDPEDVATLVLGTARDLAAQTFAVLRQLTVHIITIALARRDFRREGLPAIVSRSGGRGRSGLVR
ncbi:hypothetical protein [Actinomadura rugatobispora]|uniref:Uncharacterized protein n=1 Tax=Actinomadura rugatobispora TaxID=1994 RepID=A0ABW0ZRW9_9ACTN